MTRYTKQALPITGTMEALFRFIIIRRKSRRRYDMRGINTSSNCLAHRNKMIRKCHYNAKTALFNMLGGSYKYTSELQDYTFIYNSERSKGRRGKEYDTIYYNSQIPETERRYTYKKEEKQFKRAKKILRSKPKKGKVKVSRKLKTNKRLKKQRNKGKR